MAVQPLNSVSVVRIYVRMKLHGYRTLMRLEWRFARIRFGGDWNWRPEGNGKSNFVPEYFQIPATQNRHSPSFDSRSCLLRNRTVRGQAVTDGPLHMTRIRSGLRRTGG